MARKPDDWMPLHIGDYLADTSHLGAMEHGAYLLLLMHYWRTGSALADDDNVLARISRVTAAEWRQIKATIRAFFKPAICNEAAVLTHTRVERELQKAREYVEKKQRASAKGNASRWGSQNPSQNDPNRIASGSVCESQTDPPVTSNHRPSSSLRSDEESAERLRASAPGGSPVLELLPTNREGEEVPVSQAKADEFARLYPNVDVPQELRAMRGWLVSNPKKRKTSNGMMKFVNAWLAREQDKPKLEKGHGRDQKLRRGNAFFDACVDDIREDRAGDERANPETPRGAVAVLPAEGPHPGAGEPEIPHFLRRFA